MARRRLSWVASLLCLASVSPARSQPPAGITGYARAAGTNQPVQGTVILLQSDAGEIIQQVSTEGSGLFQFQNLRRQIYYVTAKAPGYRDITQRADLFSIARASVYFHLVPDDKHRKPEKAPGPPVHQRELRAPGNAQKEFEKGRRLLFENKEAARSISHFRKAIEIYPPYAWAYLFLGMAHMDLRSWTDAETALGKAIELDDKLATAHLALGACLNLQDKYATAEKPLLRGLELNPETADGHYELGKAYWALGRWQEAEPHVKKALTMRPEFSTGHLLLGNILMRKREAAAALQEFKEYLRLEPNGPFAPPTRDLVAKIEQALATPR